MAETIGTMPSKGTTRRTIRIEDELWNAAQTHAAADNLTVSDIIREDLARYVARKRDQALSPSCATDAGDPIRLLTEAERSARRDALEAIRNARHVDGVYVDELIDGLRPGDRIIITGVPGGTSGTEEYIYNGYETPEGSSEFRIYLLPVN